MDIKKAEYVISNTDWRKCPDTKLPEYAFIGRSNVGKSSLINGYIMGRQQLTCLMLLIDSRHEPQKIDLEFMAMLAENGIPFAIVFTKLDKLSQRQWAMNLKAYKERLMQDWEELPPIFATSAEKGTGRDELLDYIESVNKQLTINS